MNALFALALLVSPLRAGVVMPVENGVAPARPSAPVMPVTAPGGASLGSPSLGSAGDLRGTLPLLPSPVPGLLGPARHSFIGETQAAAAASVRPEAAAVRTAPAAETALRGRASDAAPAIPGKNPPGAPSTALTRDRRSAASTLENGGLTSRAAGDETPAKPLVETTSLEHARPEKAAGLGRSFFDQSDETGRAALEDPSAAAGSGDVVAATMLEGGAFGPGARLRPVAAGGAFAAGHEMKLSNPAYAPEGETLHDAVASLPGGAAASGGPGGAVAFYRSASPNGDLAKSGAPASPTAAALPVLGAPRPLAIDLSGAGLIVRVRSALSGALSPAPSAPAPARHFEPGPSTALLERGAMLEAFAVADDHAARSAAEARLQAAGAPRAAAASVPAPSPAAVPLWWAWFLLPLFVAAVRGIL